jgi:hypothetical protein
MNIKNIILGIAVIILTIFVVVYGLSVLYPRVLYEDYCNPIKTAEIIESQERCEQIGGQWNPYTEGIKELEIRGYCDRDYTCRQDYEDAIENRSKKIFYTAVPLGILIIFIGGFLFYLDAVGAGLMGGGVGTIIYGAGGYWRFGDDLFRFIISLLGLIAVIYLSYWFNSKNRKRNFFWRK